MLEQRARAKGKKGEHVNQASRGKGVGKGKNVRWTF